MNMMQPLVTATRDTAVAIHALSHQVYQFLDALIGSALRYLRRHLPRLPERNFAPSQGHEIVSPEEVSTGPPDRTLSSTTSSSSLDGGLETAAAAEEVEDEDWWTYTLRKLNENDPSLTELDLDAFIYEAQHRQQHQRNDDYDVSLESHDIQALVDALKDNTAVTSVAFRSLTVTCPSHIVGLVQAIPQLTTLHLEDTRGAGLETVARLLSCKAMGFPPRPLYSLDVPLLTNLKELKLNHAPITLSVAKTLAQGFPQCRKLQRLDFQGSRLEDLSLGFLCRALVTHKSLRYWCLDFNAFGNLGMQAVGYLLTHSASLQELHLFGNSITDVGATHLAQALPHNSTLRSLVLSLNDLGDRGVAALAQALTLNATLQKLWMPSNKVGNCGLEAVARHLPLWRGLRELNLGDAFDNRAAQAILKALPGNRVLRKLYLESPDYDCAGTDARIDFYLRLNQCGRQQWFTDDGSIGKKPALWAHALAKCQAYSDARGSPDVLLYLLQQKPTLFNHCRTTYFGNDESGTRTVQHKQET